MGSQWAIDIALRPLGAVALFAIATAIGKLVLWPVKAGPIKRSLTARLSHGQAAIGLLIVTIITFSIVIALSRSK